MEEVEMRSQGSRGRVWRRVRRAENLMTARVRSRGQRGEAEGTQHGYGT